MYKHMMMHCPMMGGPMMGYPMMDSYSNALLLFTMKIVLVLMLFACLLVVMVREREILKVLREIRDKK